MVFIDSAEDSLGFMQGEEKAPPGMCQAVQHPGSSAASSGWMHPWSIRSLSFLVGSNPLS